MQPHKHMLRLAYKKDTGTHGLPDNIDYDKGDRWLKLRICVVKGCTYSEAYDLTHESPVIRKENTNDQQ